MSPLRKMARTLYNPFRPMLLLFAFKFRKYLVEGLRNELLDDIHQDRLLNNQKIQEAISIIDAEIKKSTSIIEEIAKKSPRLSKIDVDNMITNGELEKLFAEVSNNIIQWRNCDLIFSCPITDDGMRQLLAEKEITCIRNIDDATTELQKIRSHNIGIASPWLLQDLLGNKVSSYLLFKSCKRNLYYIENTNHQLDSKTIRKCLHKIGFYEIAKITANDKLDFISIGITPDGSFSLFGSEPSLPLFSNNWSTLRASRISTSNTKLQDWENLVLTPFEFGPLGFTPPAGGFSLSVKQKLNEKFENLECINAIFSWQESGSGNASLLCSYAGPGDSYAYACTIQASKIDAPSISLWVNDGYWRILDEPKILAPNNFKLLEGIYSAAISLSITATRVIIFVDNECLFDVENVDITRTTRVGIRANGNQFGIKKIITEKV